MVRGAGTVILGYGGPRIISTCPYNGKPPAIENSLAGTIGRTINRHQTARLNWKIGIGLITSLAARETIIGTASSGMDRTRKKWIWNALRHDLSRGGAFALLVFFAFAMQCMSTTAVVRRETGGWKWPIIQFAYMGALAYIGAFVAFRVIG